MKIFATSDIHGIYNIMDKIKNIANNVDLILICVDIGGKDLSARTFTEYSKYQKQHAEYLCNNVIDKIDTPCRFILGNDDWFEFESKYYLTKKEVINDIELIPFEFVKITPFETNREANESKLIYELNKLEVTQNSIIVAHTPPLGAGDILYNGEHCGSKSIKYWIKNTQPKIWFCGHIHEDNSVSKINNTLVVNCACRYPNDTLKGWIVDSDTLEHEKVEM